MPTYEVVINRSGWERVSVEAADRDEAARKALAGEGEYVDSDTVDVSVDEIEETG